MPGMTTVTTADTEINQTVNQGMAYTAGYTMAGTLTRAAISAMLGLTLAVTRMRRFLNELLVTLTTADFDVQMGIIASQ